MFNKQLMKLNEISTNQRKGDEEIQNIVNQMSEIQNIVNQGISNQQKIVSLAYMDDKLHKTTDELFVEIQDLRI